MIYPYDATHEVATCGLCGQEMGYNVPRLGPDGGFIHKHNSSFSCYEAGQSVAYTY